MVLRFTLGSLLLFGATAHAQAGVTPHVPAPAPAPAPVTTQDPDKPQPTAAESIAELAKEKVRLEKEIQYVQGRAKNAKALLSDKLTARSQSFRSIDAGVIATPVPQAPPAAPRYARISTKDEMASLPQDTMLTVNGRPVSRGNFNQLMDHLRLSPSTGDESMRAQRALFELVMTEGMAAAFPESEAEGILADVLPQLEQGKSMADLAKAIGTVRGASPEGRVELTRNSNFGPHFEQIAFATAAGQRARPFRNAQGIVVLAVESNEKGATPELDKVTGTAIQIPHSTDQGALQKAQMSISMGQLDIVVRDDEVLQMLPPVWRQPAPVPEQIPTPVGNATALRDSLEKLQAEMTKLGNPTDAATKQRLETLQAEYHQVKLALKRAEAGGATDEGKTDVVKVEPAPKKEPPKKN